MATLPSRPPTLLLAALAGLGEFSATAYLPAIPRMAEDFATGAGVVQATVTAGMLTFAVANLILGPVSDRVGRRSVLMAALAVSLAGCALAAAAPTVAWLYPARMMTAVGACAGLAVGRAMARDLYDGPALARLMAAVTLAFSVAPVLAPLIGGVLTDAVGWRSIFVVSFLFAAVLMPFVGRFPETLTVRQTERPVRAVLADYPAMAVRRDIAIPLAASALLLAALFCFLVGAPVIFLTGLGVSPSTYGSFPLFAMSGFVLGTVLSGRLAGRVTGHGLVRRGAVIAGCGALCLCAVPVTPLWMLAALALFNTGVGIALPAAGAAVMQAFPARAGQASALIGFVQILGGALGTGVAALWTTAPDRMVPVTMAVFAALACAASAIPVAAEPGGDGA